MQGAEGRKAARATGRRAPARPAKVRHWRVNAKTLLLKVQVLLCFAGRPHAGRPQKNVEKKTSI